MKIIITEKQADKLFGQKIKCKCGHSWDEEKKINILIFVIYVVGTIKQINIMMKNYLIFGRKKPKRNDIY